MTRQTHDNPPATDREQWARYCNEAAFLVALQHENGGEFHRSEGEPETWDRAMAHVLQALEAGYVVARIVGSESGHIFQAFGELVPA